MVNKLIADEGKVFILKDESEEAPIFAKVIFLGINDSADNYEQVDESVRDEWEAEQEKKQKEEELHNLLRELYPEEG